jgi:phosphopentomutase
MSEWRAVVLIVLDSVGIGGAPDADEFGDAGSATLPHVAEAVGGIKLPNLGGLGLGRLADIKGVDAAAEPTGAYGVMTERSPGKDTTTGHWEIAGVILDKPFPTYPDGFPPDVMDAFENAIESPTLGNYAASGTEIIEQLGKEHMDTGYPIVYTSADSVFQIAAHVDVVPLERVYEWCKIARELLRGEHEVGRVIARPFRGEPGSFERTPDRHDYSVLPPRPTMLDYISEAGLDVRGVGKISDIFGGRGVTHSTPTKSNEAGIDVVIEEARTISQGLVFANLVDFDQSFGHRNDPKGYANALEQFDRRLPEITDALGDDAVLIITADHGNDPTTPSTDHSRERVPVLCTGAKINPTDLEIRESFTDCGATVLDLLGIEAELGGLSWAAQLRRDT